MRRLIQLVGDKVVRQFPLEKYEYTLGRGKETILFLILRKYPVFMLFSL